MAKKTTKDVEVVEEAKETKPEKKKESLLSKIIWWTVVVLVAVWLVIFLTDFFTTKAGKAPKFCITNEIRDYTDGSVKVCNGIGYKYIEYNRKEIKGSEFGPFWISVDEKQED